MSMKLNLRDKKRKKSLKTTKSRSDKLIYEIRRSNFTKEKHKTINNLHDQEAKAWKQQRDSIAGKFKLKVKSPASSLTSTEDYNYPYLASNPAADDSLQLNDNLYLSDTHSLEYPIRIDSIFVICNVCKQPVCTGSAGSIVYLNSRYHYKHLKCCH